MEALELEVTKGPWAGQKISVNEDYAVGRAEAGPGTLGGDRWLSPSHARFRRGPDSWMLEDLGSLEGTKVNGSAIRGAVALNVGDVVELGSSRIVVLPDGGATVARLHAESPRGVAEELRAQNRRPLDGRRVIAFLIDVLVLLPVGALAIHIGRGRWVFSVAGIGMTLTYYFLCESLTGQTLGKRLARLKVVRVDGMPLVPSRVAARTVLRIVDQYFALIGLLTMVFSGGRRQRLGDLAARTAVVRSDAPGPRPARHGRERFALYAYPALWLAPFVLMYSLIPDARVLPCREAGISSASGKEGSCLSTQHGVDAVFDIVNAGHTLRMPGYSVRLAGTAVRPRGRDAVVSFRLAVHNDSGRKISFDRRRRELVLFLTRPDALYTVPFPEVGLRRSVRRTPALVAGRTRSVWASFRIPSGGVPQLTQPVSGLGIAHQEPHAGLPHIGEIRLWRVSTPAGMRALSGLHD